ncbi:hypothetical protein NUU61_005418 [Penicillium alfredii]|uniref:Uncharacterized protein n=1 Tax=Penicillium alfredii TaxID=1506179 RepID=A0A9W9K8L8_9EURO|nr:uncharacterized protein NUU61_005418 [Penicillium alfredii]KAJ5096062.1 hypothetical protein NUU61_005418 [Penicillium alfredii]
MSHRLNEPRARYSMIATDETPRDLNSGTFSASHRSDGSSRRAAPPMNNGRASGELEGSTLGSSSREGDRKTSSSHRQTQSSSGFLVDSLPPSKSSRTGSYRARPPEPPTEKRAAPEPEIVVPKKRLRFPWKKHKNSVPESSSAAQSSTPVTDQTPTPPPDTQPSRSSTQPEVKDNLGQSAPGFDRDSLQIVNLALNLNESRRRTASGLPPGQPGRRPLSISQPAAPTDIYGASPGPSQSPRDFAHPQQGRPSGDGFARATQPGGPGQPPVVDLLPPSVVDDHREYEFSDSTFARADKARRHFDLFHEYLRLLPSLPPLRNPPVDGDLDSQSPANAPLPANRGYNPLQMIRNRRVRYREKCTIDAQADGWHDVDRVHQWINAVEKKYSHRVHDQKDSLQLPPFQLGQRHVSRDDPDDVDMIGASPPSSLRRASRTSSVKAPRPRLDWIISPVEMLADAAWVEDGTNKAKIVDREGHKIYPDPTQLALVDTNTPVPQKQRPSVEIVYPASEEHSSRPTSMSSSHPALGPEFRRIGRGRDKSHSRNHSHTLESGSISSSRKRSRLGNLRVRASSVSSDSSAQLHSSMDRNRQTSWDHFRKDTGRHPRDEQPNALESRTPYDKSPAAVPNARADRTAASQLSELPPITTQWKQMSRRASLSSNGSVDDRFNPRMSMEGMDSTAPNSPAHAAGYFPSIAVNLSPPSSRSPSPAKKGLRHKIASRHERSKSKQRILEAQEHEDDVLDSEAMRQQNLAPSSEGTSKLEPSPLPDVVSSSYADDQIPSEAHRMDDYRVRRGPHGHESKLKGIFKGPGRITKLVGNEVSKVGDFILKKEPMPSSRKSSSATTSSSDDSDSDDDEETRTDKRAGSKGLLRRLPPFADEPARLTHRDSDKGMSSRSFLPSLPAFTSPLRQDDRGGTTDASEFGSPYGRGPALRRHDDREISRQTLPRSKTLDFGPALPSSRDRLKPHQIKDPSVPFSLTRPPVTGLAKARASRGPSPDNRSILSGASRAWSISDRSLKTPKDSGVPGKTEVERTRALFLSSGIKAREITRRAHSSRDPVPHWLQSALGPSASVPRVARSEEFHVAAQSLLRRFEITQYSFQNSMHNFSTGTSSPLRSQLKDLETLVNQTLTPRVRATANEAEDLCVELNTTSTLAVKQLSDALDKGVRKRRRRLRWVRRAGFSMLEWALVGALWWVWLIVMVFKLVRGIFRGAVSSVRWILWL